jgi:squalene-associated FAD-dependent desaturase
VAVAPVTRPRIAVVGGGLAGLSAAVACADAGAHVGLFEARPRLGGATWSAHHEGLGFEVDNGQHVFLRCCEAYRGFLRRLGAEDRVVLQDRLAIPVATPGRPTVRLSRCALPSPLHLAPSLLGFAPLSWGERLRAARTARRLGRLDLADDGLDAHSFGAWLAEQGESAGAVDRFWDLIARPTLNLPARDASLALAVKVFQTGLLDRADAADLGYARVPLARLHAEPAAAALVRAGAELRLRAPVEAIAAGGAGSAAGTAAAGVRAGGHWWEADAIVLAVPHDAAAALLPPEAGVDPGGLRRLGAAPIVNLHVVFDRPVTSLPFLTGVDTPLQWIFDRSAAVGLERGQYLTVALSAADAWVGRSRAELRRIFVPEFARLLPAARAARVERFFATCERAATFRQVPGTRRLRPGPRTALPYLFLAGAWTDTGWPATMEGAVRSGLLAAHHALRATGRARALPALAA